MSEDILKTLDEKANKNYVENIKNGLDVKFNRLLFLCIIVSVGFFVIIGILISINISIKDNYNMDSFNNAILCNKDERFCIDYLNN